MTSQEANAQEREIKEETKRLRRSGQILTRALGRVLDRAAEVLDTLARGPRVGAA